MQYAVCSKQYAAGWEQEADGQDTDRMHVNKCAPSKSPSLPQVYQ